MRFFSYMKYKIKRGTQFWCLFQQINPNRKPNMYKPHLKRESQQSLQSTYPNTFRSTRFKLAESRPNLAQERTLVPQAFFQQSKNVVQHRKIGGLAETINTCDFSYPAAVESQISSENPGCIELNEQIFCFYKQKDVYFWQYSQNNFTSINKIVKIQCEDVITAIAYRTVTFNEFQGRTIILVSISYGPVVRFYRLRNFERQNTSIKPELLDMKICIYGNDVITNISICFEENPDGEVEKNQLSIIIGDANGNIIYFDFVTKRKYILETLKQKLKRKAQRQTYSEIVQILHYRQYIFCIVNRHYERGTAWKFIQKIMRSQKANKFVEQRLQIYRKQAGQLSFVNAIKNSLTTGTPFSGFRKHCQYSSEQIVQKMKSSYGRFFDYDEKTQTPPIVGLIDSMSLKKGLVQLIFSSGISILIDQQVSFGGPPKPKLVKPATFSFLGANVSNQYSLSQQNRLIKSMGSDIMLYEDFIASETDECLYISPYSCKQNRYLIRSLKRLKDQNSSQFYGFSFKKFIILKNASFTVVEPLSPILVMFIYCYALNANLPSKKYSPQLKKFQDRIQRMVEYFGESEILLTLIKFLMKVRLQQKFNINLRIDLLELAIKQLSDLEELTYREGIKMYEQNDRNSVKNTLLQLTNESQEMIWNIILKLQRSKVKLTKSNKLHMQEIEAICVTFQTLISEIFKQIHNWNTKKFCMHRPKIYKILTNSKILSEIIQSYLSREQQRNANKASTRNSLTLQTGVQFYSAAQSQSFKAKFCQLAIVTIQKVTLLLNVYDFVCEMDFHGTAVPKFSELVFGMNQKNRILFAQTVVNTLGLNNQFLIDSLIVKIPELHLEQVRKFNLWLSLHEKPNSVKVQQQNRTIDTNISIDSQAQDVAELINEVNYKQVEKFYVSSNQDSHYLVPILDSSKQTAQWANGATLMLKACLMKIGELRKSEISTHNMISVCKTLLIYIDEKSFENYFGVLEIPTLKTKADEILKEISFFVDCCQQLIQKIFLRYSRSLLTKEAIAEILESLKGYMTIEVRESLEKQLKKYNIGGLEGMVSRKQLFSGSKPKSLPNNSSSNFLAHQLSEGVVSRYF